MNPERLTGFVYPVKKNGVPVRGRFQLWVNLPSEPAFDRDGQPVLDAKGRQKQKYPKTTKVVEAKGKKAAERLLETWIAELESHRTIDPDRLKLAELLDRWLEATSGEMRVASYNSYRRIRRIHVDPALGQVLAGKLTRAQLSTYYAAKMRGSKKAKPLAETTVAHHHAMLKTAYNWALEEELLLVNPALRVKNPPALRPKTAPRLEHGGDREHGDQGPRPAGPRRRRARRLLRPQGGGGRGTALVRPRPQARLRHRLPHDRRGRRRHAPRVPAEERQGPRRAPARRRLRRAARLARRAEGVPPGAGPGVERGRPRGPQEGRQPDGALDPEEPVVELGGTAEDRPAPADPRPAATRSAPGSTRPTG